MALIIMGLTLIFLCLKKGDLKNWRVYYPTILFYIVVDFSNVLLTSNKDLWEINGFWNDTLADMFISFAIAPFVVILFLSNYPKKVTKQIGYILLYAAVFSIIEYIAGVLKGIVYYNGWNYGWSIMLYITAFILFGLHHKNPLWAWLLLLILTGAVLLFFKISLLNLK
ncbi:MAG: CBO0543 family protein [Bacillota bacterium]|nr:CBO0543 family protein [Bacillota bacterium]